MMKAPKAATPAWYAFYADRIEELGAALDLPPVVREQAQSLWVKVVGVPRSPLPLVVDCIYICALLSGNRASIKKIKRTTKRLWERTIEILPLDKRRQDRRWVWPLKAEILSMYPDEDAWDDFVGAWENKIVDVSYFDEKDGEGE